MANIDDFGFFGHWHFAPVDARSKFYRSRVPGPYDGSQELWLRRCWRCRKITRYRHPFSTRVARTYKYLGSPPGPCKLLEVLVSTFLKRLASAVRFRPWPPFFLSGRFFCLLAAVLQSSRFWW